MDGERFDRIARSLAGTTSRRRVLRGLAAGAAGALAGAVGLRRAGAGVAPANCSAYGRVCTYTGCCTTPGAECRCYPNGHCRCLCPEGTSFSNGACVAPAAAGTCPAGENACFTAAGCNDTVECFCFQTTENATFCGLNRSEFVCGECTTSADCVRNPAFGPGTFCVQAGGGTCACAAGEGICQFPCPAPA